MDYLLLHTIHTIALCCLSIAVYFISRNFNKRLYAIEAKAYELEIAPLTLSHIKREFEHILSELEKYEDSLVIMQTVHRDMRDLNDNTKERLDYAVANALDQVSNQHEKYMLQMADKNIVLIETFLQELKALQIYVKKDNIKLKQELAKYKSKTKTAPKKRGRPKGWKKAKKAD